MLAPLYFMEFKKITSADIPLGITGDRLIEAMNATQEGRKPIAEGLIYEETMLMVSSEPGCGKSTISLQVAVELAAGLPVFGYFQVPKPVKVLYIQWERSILEVLERLKVISETYPIIKENIVVTDEYQKLNLFKDFDTLMACIERDAPDVKVIFLDPIYATMLGGLKDDRPAAMFTHLWGRIQNRFKCSLWYNHHVVKQQYSSEGFKIEKDDPFYGSQWLKAHVTGSYIMQEQKDKDTKRTGVILHCKKDNYGVLTKTIELVYNPETELCMLSDGSKMQSMDRFKHFLRLKQMQKKEFTFKEIEAETMLCTRTIRAIFCTPQIKDLLNKNIVDKNKIIYTVKDIAF